MHRMNLAFSLARSSLSFSRVASLTFPCSYCWRGSEESSLSQPSFHDSFLSEDASTPRHIVLSLHTSTVRQSALVVSERFGSERRWNSTRPKIRCGKTVYYAGLFPKLKPPGDQSGDFQCISTSRVQPAKAEALA